jgi:hypothetical protein
MLDDEGYRHTLRICNTYCFFVVKVKFILEQAMEAQRGIRGIALLFL